MTVTATCFGLTFGHYHEVNITKKVTLLKYNTVVIGKWQGMPPMKLHFIRIWSLCDIYSLRMAIRNGRNIQESTLYIYIYIYVCMYILTSAISKK